MVAAHALPQQSTAPPPSKKVLLIGVTGVTGRSAVGGLLSATEQQSPASPELRLSALTRSLQGSTAAALRALTDSIGLVEGDLDDEGTLRTALQGVDMIYCHALSKDAAQADPAEIVRAQRLGAAAAAAGVQLIIYNSSGGKGCGSGISQVEQKHRVEDVFSASGVPLVALQAPLFMEEWWKKYTRPSILKGSFPLSVPSDKPLQLLAARDLGLAAATVLQDPTTFAGRAIELAGDELTPAQMCAAFARAQGRPVSHSRPPAWLFWFLSKDVYRICRFLTDRGFGADVAACRREFPGLMTFDQFLQRTAWADATRTYEQGITFSAPDEAAAPRS